MNRIWRFGVGRIQRIALAVSLAGLLSCSSTDSLFSPADCSDLTPGSLSHYDSMSLQFLDEATSDPSGNAEGDIVWGTRYYLESLLDAYESTANPKYIQAFMNSASVVMGEVQSLSVVDIPDPSAPGNTTTSPSITVTGWPTLLGSFSESVPIPTSTGQVSLYAQNLDPTDPNGPIYLQVTPQGSGILLSWVNESQTLESHAIGNSADLTALSSAPLTEGQSYGRISATGLGLPAPGTYQVNSPIETIWHEQTGGILLPIARFLVMAQTHPGLANPSTLASWKSQILTIADSYENDLVPDNEGGLRLQNPMWLPNALAGTRFAADYVAVEATMRMFLYILTGDQNQLAIAQGLVNHQKNYHWQTNSEGWLLLKLWPCMVPWSTSAAAPAGSVWSSYSFDPEVPSPVEDGAAYVDLFHQASQYGLSATLGIPPDIYAENQATLQQYLFIGPRAVDIPTGILRGSYPQASSTKGDPLTSSQYTWSGAWYVDPEVADPNYVNTNWRWMLRYAQNPQGNPPGYFLRAWAMSEAAEYSVCQMK